MGSYGDRASSPVRPRMPSIQPTWSHLRRRCVRFVLLLFPALLRGQDLAFEPLALQGMPATRLAHIAETADGRMWFGNAAGLWLHEGAVATEVSIAEVSAGLHRLRCIGALHDGSLLIGLDRGLARIRAGDRQVERLSTPAELRVESIAADADGGAWLAGEDGLWRMSPSGLIGAVPLPVADCARGVHFAAGQLWVWSPLGVWRLAIGTPGAAWQQHVDFGVRAAAGHGSRLLVASEAGLAALDPTGETEWLLRGQTVHGLAVSGDAIWLHGDEVPLSRLLHGQTRAAPVRFYHRRNALQVASVSRLCLDHSGLLWVSGAAGVWRLEPLPGIDHCVLPQLSEGERVTVAAERADGRVMLGTSYGTLLTAVDPAATGWEAPERPFGDTPIGALHDDGRGRIWVATRRRGLWRREGDGWRTVATCEVGDNVRDLAEFEGDLVVCGGQAALRIHHDDSCELMPFADPRPDGRMLPSCLKVGGDGALWLGSYRNGLHRWDPATNTFRRVALEGEAVLRIAPMPGLRQVLAVGVGSVYDVDPAGAARRLPDMEHGTPFRELVVAGDGELWGARPGQLFQREANELLQLAAGYGAHPLGYSFGGGLATGSGEVWLGASMGYTRVRAGSSLRAAARAEVLGFRLLTPGGASSWHEAGATITAQPGFRIEPRIVAHILDVPTPHVVRLESATGTTIDAGDDGAFRGEVGERYRLVVEFSQVTGVACKVGIGSVTVRTTPGNGGIAIGLGMVAVVLLGVLGWRSRRRAQGVESAVLVDTLRAIGQDPDSVLDLAFVVAAAAERGKALVQATTASVWIRVPEQPATPLLTFGAAAGVEGSNPHQLHAFDPDLPRGISESDRHVTIRLPGPAGIEFVVLLSGIVRGECGRGRELEEVLAPARAALERRIWLERLQSSYVKSSLSMEAHLHDMRSALTSLRLGVGELRLQHGSQDPVVQSVAGAMDGLLQAVEALRSRDAVELFAGDPVAIVAEVGEAMRPQAVLRKIALVLQSPDTVSGVRLDPVWFRRAVENSIGNALKYSPDATRVLVTCSVESERFLVFVDDEGPGIDAEEQKRLFLPGMVGRAQPHNGEQKSGIGLWISRQAMRAMGGSMWIEPRPGGGTRVVMQLPRHGTHAMHGGLPSENG